MVAELGSEHAAARHVARDEFGDDAGAVDNAVRAVQRRFMRDRRGRRSVPVQNLPIRPGLGVLYDRCEAMIGSIGDRLDRQALSTEREFTAAANHVKSIRQALLLRLQELDRPDHDAEEIREQVKHLFYFASEFPGGISAESIVERERILAKQLRKRASDLLIRLEVLSTRTTFDPENDS